MDGLAEYSSTNVMEPPSVDVIIEIPRWSFLKRGSTGSLNFVSPLPCPFNYGSVPRLIGGEGDLLDAVVMGPRLPYGNRVTVNVYGAIGISERFLYDDKLICHTKPLTDRQVKFVLRFFRFYAFCKGLLNRIRGHEGKTCCEGWCDAGSALARAQPREKQWHGPTVSF